MPTDSGDPKSTHRYLRALWFLTRWGPYLLGTLWTFGAVYFDGPATPSVNLFIAVSWAAVTMTYLVFLRGAWRRGLVNEAAHDDPGFSARIREGRPGF